MTKQKVPVRVVMVSSTARDLPNHRDQVMSACLQQNLFPKMMEHLPASDANAIRVSMQMVDDADLYVGVVGFRYGYVPRGHNVSITEMEYDRAGERGIPRLMFLMHEDHILRAADVETGAGAAKLREFRQRIAEDRVIALFSSPDDLRANVIQALSEFRATPIQEELISSQVSTAAYGVAVLNQSALVAVEEVEAVFAALQAQVHRDLATTWGIDAQLSLVRPGDTPPDKTWWFHLQDKVGAPGVLAYHDVNAAGLPRARVGVTDSINSGLPWSVAASHTLLQLLANPKGNVVVMQGDRFIPQEICWPCPGERWAYLIDGIKVSDFVLPAWYDGYRKERSARFDHCGHISEPYQVLPGGYMKYFEKATEKFLMTSRKPVKVARGPRSRKRDVA
jgi:hypothetical protein